MISIDKSSYYETPKNGTFPKWFSTTGTLFVFTGIWAVMATGLLPLFCRQKCRKCGGSFWARLMEGFCSYLILIYALLITIIMNLIGSMPQSLQGRQPTATTLVMRTTATLLCGTQRTLSPIWLLGSADHGRNRRDSQSAPLKTHSSLEKGKGDQRSLVHKIDEI